nr:hypothetical protein [Marinobacter salsuginis]
MPGLPAALHLAKKMGQRLGQCALLQRTLPA